MGENAMQPGRSNAMSGDKPQPFLRRYLPTWAADTLAEFLKYPAVPGMRAPVMAGGLMPADFAIANRLANKPAYPNGAPFPEEMITRPATEPAAPYPDVPHLSRMVGSRAANSNASPEGEPMGYDPAFDSWAMNFLKEFEAEQASKLAHIRKPDLTLIPGGKQD